MMSENWPHWHYRGRVTHPVDIPGVGPVVLTPRAQFQAPAYAVKDLLRAKLVKRIEPPKGPKPAPKEASEPRGAQDRGQSTAPEAKKALGTKSDPKEVDSSQETPKSEDEPVSAATADPVLASDQPAQEEDGTSKADGPKDGGSSGSRRRRGGRRG